MIVQIFKAAALSALLFVQLTPARAPELWVTAADQSALLERRAAPPFMDRSDERIPLITIDPERTFQPIEGFGYTLTGGSAYVLARMQPTARRKILRELFGSGRDSIGVSYLRLSIGASDLNFEPYSYDDVPAGATDLNLERFSMRRDDEYLIPVLKEIVRINPKITFLGSPWSAPPWMKDKFSFVGGRLQPKYYEVYARYFVRYISEMASHGIRIDAVTPQNEPLHDGNNPSMLMPAKEQIEFVKVLGAAFEAAGIKTKIIVYDHNCDKPEYPIEVLNDPIARKYIAGSAFHLYGGDIGCLSKVSAAHPDKAVYFTEQYTNSKSDFGKDLRWHFKNVLIGATRNGARSVLEWNLANDAEFKPFTPGGCSVCRGALTIDGDKVTRNVAYYIIAHAAKFIPPGSVRIHSDVPTGIANVAFLTPDRKIVMIVLNESKEPVAFRIKNGTRYATVTLPANAVGTLIWRHKR